MVIDLPGGDAEGPNRKQRIAGYLVVSTGLVACEAAGFLLVGDPTNLSRGVWGWVALVVGAAFSLFAAFSTPFIGEWGRRLAARLPGLPDHVAEQVNDHPLRLPLGILATIAVVLIAFLVPSPSVSTSDLEPGEIVVYSAFDESPRDPRRILIDQWNQTHPANRVRVEDVRPEHLHDRAVNDANPGGAHEADIYVLDNVWMPEFIRGAYVLSLNQALRISQDGDFLSKALDTCRDRLGGREGLWCLPLNTDAGLMFRRTGLQGSTEPVGWDGYFGEGARQILSSVRGNPANQSALANLESATAGQMGDGEALTVNALEAIWAAGGEVVNSDGRLVLNADGSVVEFDDRAIEGVRRLARAYSDRSITTSDTPTANENRSAEAFASGKALFMRNWPVWNDLLSVPTSGNALLFEASGLGWDSVLGGQNLAISSSTDKPRAAQAFLEFMASPGSQLTLLEVGGFAPVRPEAYSNASPTSRRYAQELRASVERARLRPLLACYDKFSVEFRNGIVRALRNNGNIEPDFPRSLATAGRC